MKTNNVEHLNALQTASTHVTTNASHVSGNTLRAFHVLLHLIFRQLNERDQVITPTYE